MKQNNFGHLWNIVQVPLLVLNFSFDKPLVTMCDCYKKRRKGGKILKSLYGEKGFGAFHYCLEKGARGNKSW